VVSGENSRGVELAFWGADGDFSTKWKMANDLEGLSSSCHHFSNL